MQKDKTLIDKKTTTQMVLEIIEDGNKPRTIREIQQRYDLKFPFRVKKVVMHEREHEAFHPFPVGSVVEIAGYITKRNTKTQKEFTANIEPVNTSEAGTTWLDVDSFAVYVLV